MQVEHQGCSLRVVDEGRGAPIVWIQGTGIAASGWRPQTEALRPRFRCVSFDHRGVGGSVPNAARITVDLLARDTLAVMDAAGLERAHLVGHSLGGLVALSVARLARQRVSSLGLLCTFASGWVPLRPSLRVAWLGAWTVVGSRASRRRAFLRMVRSPAELAGRDLDLEAEALGEEFGRDLAEPPAVVREQLWAMAGADETPHLGALAGLPTLVISGAHDLLAPPAAGRAIAAAVSGARYVELTEAGHALPITRAEVVNQELERHFLAADAGSRA